MFNQFPIINRSILLIIILFSLNSCDTETILNHIEQEKLSYYIDSLSKNNHNNLLYINDILLPTEPNEIVVNSSLRKFNLKSLINININKTLDSLIIESYSAKPIEHINIYMKLPNIDDKIHIAFVDTLSDFSKINFKPNFLEEKTIYKVNDGRLFSIIMDLLNKDIQFWI